MLQRFLRLGRLALDDPQGLKGESVLNPRVRVVAFLRGLRPFGGECFQMNFRCGEVVPLQGFFQGVTGNPADSRDENPQGVARVSEEMRHTGSDQQDR